MNRRHEPLDPEERALAHLLGTDDAVEPSAALDARILAAARASTQAPASSAQMAAQATSRRRPRARWSAALGLAASVTLAIGVAWQLREPPRPQIESAPASASEEPVTARYSTEAADTAGAAAEVAPTPPSTHALPTGSGQTTDHAAAVAAASARTAQRKEKADRQAQAELQAGIDAEAERARAQQVAVAAAEQRSAQRQEKAEQQARNQAIAEAEQARDHQAAVAAASQRSAQRTEKAARQLSAPAAPTPAALPPPPPSPVMDVAQARPSDVFQEPSPPAPPPPVAPATDYGDFLSISEPATQAEGRRPSAGFTPDPAIALAASASDTSAVATANVIDEDARLPAAQWLQRIRQRNERGEVALARASLERFVRQHPQMPVPDDLRPLLP